MTRSTESEVLAAVLEASRESLIVVGDRDAGVIDAANPATEAMLAFDRGALAGERFGRILAGGDAEAASLLSRGGDAETHYVGRDGQRIAVRLRIAGGGDTPIVVAALPAEDAETLELLAGARRDRAIVSAIPDLMFRLDAGGTFLDFQPGKDATRPYVPPERFLGRHMSEVLPPDIAERLFEVSRQALADQAIQTHDYSMVYKGETEAHQFEARAVPVGDDELVWFAREVTELRRSENRLRASEERFRLIAETTDDVIYLRDVPSGRLVYVSPSCRRVFGVAPEALSSDRMGWGDLVAPEDRERVERAAAEVLERERFDEVYRVVRPDGESRWVRDRGYLAAHENERRCVVGSVQDITEQRALEEELRLSQKMDAIGQLASGVAHDFRNLLTGILGCARIARERLDEPARAREFIDEIESAAETGATITQQLLEYARRDAPTPEPHDLDALIEEAQMMLRVLLGDEIVLITRLSSGASVRLDRAEMHRVLMNLAANARDAMDSGGRMVIETRQVAGDAAPGSLAGQAHALIIVSDTGHGMSEATARRALEPFFTTKEPGKGTGLGLSAVYAIIRKAGGHTELRSVSGKGTTVELRLPLAGPPSVASRPIPRDQAVAAQETVLLVEDNTAVRRINRYYLEQAGYQVVEAASGTEAVERGVNCAIDVILTDVMLPGLSGRRVVERVLEVHPNARVVYMSAYPTQWLLEEGRIPTDTISLRKPFDRRTLLEALRAPSAERSGPTND